jgi:aldehyde:ferredoxin oxidoreductase
MNTAEEEMSNYGYAGKILRVDLSSGNITVVPTAEYAERFVGGRGIAAKIYWDEVPPEVGPFDAENCLVFMTGPLAGFPGLAGSRWTICGKSPSTTPHYFSYCNLGGSWGAHLKFAGCDGVIVQGKSDRPVYLFVEDGAAQIRDASQFWGKSSVEVRESIKAELGASVRVAAIGPAGENLVSFAIVLADEDSSGSSGFGAVMGSKRLKAIAVRGSNKVTAAHPEELRQLSAYARELARNVPTVQRSLMPGPRMKRAACYGCISGCIRATTETRDGVRGKHMCESAQFYQEWAKRYYGEWGSEGIEVSIRANRLCDGYGIDTNCLSAMLLWLARCHGAGILTDEDSGIPISKLGSLEFIEALVKSISLREGFGDALAQGTIKAARMVGRGAEGLITGYIAKDGAMVMYEPRMFPTHSLFYAMEPRRPMSQLHEMAMPMYRWIDWANGIKTAFLTSDAFRQIARRYWGSELAVDFSTYKGKALAAKRIQDRQCARESLILCDIAINWTTAARDTEGHVGAPALDSQMLSAVTGREIDEESLYEIGERVFNQQRAILVREGHRGRDSDRLEETYHTRPLKFVALNDGVLAPGQGGKVISRRGAVVERDAFEALKDEYYELRGWDVRSGLQTKAKLVEVGLSDIVDDLERRELVVYTIGKKGG